ncbi:MAG: NAD(P)/FAD-dependent oxidoreductase [Phycisphaerales bacterium]|nr:NAD(P)/FAD-dependent oxidoreductase [Phycisphaerales bacterium]
MDGPTQSAEVAIVGGGAAGLATAIFFARHAPGRSVVVLDGAAKLGAKILVSGGGRCNVTNRTVSAADFYGGSPNVVKRILAEFSASDTVAFFNKLGVELHEEEHGKLFPNTNDARTVLDALLNEAGRVGVQLLAGHRVTDVSLATDGFAVAAGATTTFARAVVLATGGRSLPKSGSDGFGYQLAQNLGHSLVPVTPALVPLVLDGEFHKPLSGVSHPVELTVHADGAKPVRIRGMLLWTHFGISGPVVLDASRHWHRARVDGRDATVSASFLPDHDPAAIDGVLIALASSSPAVHLRNALARLLPSRVADAVVGKLNIEPSTVMAQLTKDARRLLGHALGQWSLPVRDSRGYKYAEVTAGGIPLDEVDPRTLASRKCPGLYLVGEILDVDGRIGGFNFQWSWSSAWVAAMALARRFNASELQTP